MFNNIILFVALAVSWFVFSGYDSVFFLASGAVSCVVAVVIARRMGVIQEGGYPLYLSLNAPFYFLWLVKEIIISALNVALRVWQPEPRIRPSLFWVSASQEGDVGKAAYANSITLTPGTVCVGTKADMLRVHALTNKSAEGLRSGVMDKKVTELTG